MRWFRVRVPAGPHPLFPFLFPTLCVSVFARLSSRVLSGYYEKHIRFGHVQRGGAGTGRIGTFSHPGFGPSHACQQKACQKAHTKACDDARQNARRVQSDNGLAWQCRPDPDGNWPQRYHRPRPRQGSQRRRRCRRSGQSTQPSGGRRGQSVNRGSLGVSLAVCPAKSRTDCPTGRGHKSGRSPWG